MRRDRQFFAVIAVAATAGLTACGGASTGGGPSPDGMLMMRMPSAPTAQVTRSDTSVVSVDTGVMGTMEMNVEDLGTIDLEFADAGGTVQVTATYSEFVGKMSNPMAGDINVNESDIGGQLVFTLDDRAHATVQQGFDVKMEAAQMVGSKTLAYDLFPRFPRGAMGMGQTWVDTVEVEEAGDFTATTSTITTYVVQGDTMVDGRSLVKLNTTSEIALSTIGENQGMSMSQNLSGTATGWILWDRSASMTYMSFSESDMNGMVSVDMAGVPDMSLAVTSRSHTRVAY